MSTATFERSQRAAGLLLRTSRGYRVFALVLGALAVSIVLALFLPWQQTADGSGRVVAFTPMERRQEIDAPIEGRVVRWNVREGSKVQQGDLLLELADNDPDILRRLEAERTAVMARRDAAVTRATAIQRRQEALQSSRRAGTAAAQSRVQMARGRVEAASQSVEAAKAARVTAQLNLERQEKLFAQGLSSQRAVELAQLELVRTTTELERSQAGLQAARSEELALESDRTRLEHDFSASLDDARASEASALADEANAAAELARLEVRLARQSTMEVRAPMEGTVLKLHHGQGNAFVKAGEPLLTLVPDTRDRAVELWVDGNDLPLLEEGREVRLQFEGWPAVQFSGWPSVAVGTFGGRITLIDPTDDGEGQFRVLVQPMEDEGWPEGRFLRQGVRAKGWVLLQRVSLGFELWRRFNGFPPALKTPAGVARAKGKDKAS